MCRDYQAYAAVVAALPLQCAWPWVHAIHTILFISVNEKQWTACVRENRQQLHGATTNENEWLSV